MSATEFDGKAARTAADEGMEKARRAQRVQFWKEQADDWLRGRVAGDEFTADDLVASIGLPDEGVARNNVVGAWVNAKAKAGLIVWTNAYRRSARVVGHGNPQKVWRVVSGATMPSPPARAGGTPPVKPQQLSLST